MKILPKWLVTVAQVGLAGAWLMSGIIYIATPKAMERVLGMPDDVRLALGVAMLVLAIVLLAGAATRRSAAFAIGGLTAATFAGLLWVVYDIVRAWDAFALFHGALSALAAALLLKRIRAS
ncbi:MAG TPA: hypothetical protein VKT51_05590 [Candidatus Eremiobacteraceae bacterium]|nr:hypothetical protein [Candidatus Eremiobacteraceae bacterium]